MRRCDSAGEFPKAGEIFLTMHIPYSEDGEEIVETCAQASRHTIELALAKDVSPVGSYFCFGPRFSGRNRD